MTVIKKRLIVKYLAKGLIVFDTNNKVITILTTAILDGDVPRSTSCGVYIS